MTTGWSIYITVLALANILGCLWLLWWTSRRPAGEVTGETTGHTWDNDLRELNNPLPRWWLVLFYLTVFFALGYLVLFPGLGNYGGTLGWTQAKKYETESALADAVQREAFAKFDGLELAALAGNDEARSIGSRLFANNCAVCHGADGHGAPGFPDLADDDWLYGSDAPQIIASITHGRAGMMPPMGAALGEQGIKEVSAWVYQRNGRAPQPGTVSMLAAGEQKFGMFCAACHGQDATGSTTVGAPNLADETWLYGGSIDTIRKTITEGRSSRMPAHEKLLNADEIRLLAAYVQGLSSPGSR